MTSRLKPTSNDDSKTLIMLCCQLAQLSYYAARTMRYQGSMMVDICDIDLIGTKLEQNGLVVHLTKEYYQQEVIEQTYARLLLQKCDIANLVGNRIIKQAIEMKLAKEVSIRKIGGVPFLMIYKFQH